MLTLVKLSLVNSRRDSSNLRILEPYQQRFISKRLMGEQYHFSPWRTFEREKNNRKSINNTSKRRGRMRLKLKKDVSKRKQRRPPKLRLMRQKELVMQQRERKRSLRATSKRISMREIL